jgi:hypothetical protein
MVSFSELKLTIGQPLFYFLAFMSSNLTRQGFLIKTARNS